MITGVKYCSSLADDTTMEVVVVIRITINKFLKHFWDNQVIIIMYFFIIHNLYFTYYPIYQAWGNAKCNSNELQ